MESFDNILTLLKKKTTTIDTLIKYLSSVIEKFQQTQQDIYIEQLKERLQGEGVTLTEEELSSHAESIHKQVIKDTEPFVKMYTDQMLDNTLDAINNKTLKKKPAHAFLIVLLFLQQTYQKF